MFDEGRVAQNGKSVYMLNLKQRALARDANKQLSSLTAKSESRIYVCRSVIFGENEVRANVEAGSIDCFALECERFMQLARTLEPNGRIKAS